MRETREDESVALAQHIIIIKFLITMKETREGERRPRGKYCTDPVHYY